MFSILDCCSRDKGEECVRCKLETNTTIEQRSTTIGLEPFPPSQGPVGDITAYRDWSNIGSCLAIEYQAWWSPGPLNSTRRHGMFLNLTGDIGLHVF